MLRQLKLKGTQVLQAVSTSQKGHMTEPLRLPTGFSVEAIGEVKREPYSRRGNKLVAMDISNLENILIYLQLAIGSITVPGLDTFFAWTVETPVYRDVIFFPI